MPPWNYFPANFSSGYEGTPEYIGSPVSVPGSSLLSYYFCLHCGIPRSTKLIYEGICVYCLEYEQKYCIFGEHEENRRNFIDRHGVEKVRCNNCRDDDEDVDLTEKKEENDAESSDEEETDSELSDVSNDVIELDAPAEAQNEPQVAVQAINQPDTIIVDAPEDMQKDPQGVAQTNTKTDNAPANTPKDAQNDAQGVTQENQADLVLVDLQGDAIVVLDVPGDVQDNTKGDFQADLQENIQENSQVGAQDDTPKTIEEKTPPKKSPEPKALEESVKIKTENDDSIQIALNRIPVVMTGGDDSSDPIILD
ncbi:uncharacterized protein N7483_001125 [Penicillium malachiteum]|uniref:uncharacterized protein n=1 Tax=Penicillium malachiteum TaxID=1324776 RepID=UPI002547454B|nr:uncharacterized protein N7483_001125 [Penicillium malachiteum]KAJ5736000.1 hypothetical protein N7483_001125 [Penicillium malachiteum]